MLDVVRMKKLSPFLLDICLVINIWFRLIKQITNVLKQHSKSLWQKHFEGVRYIMMTALFLLFLFSIWVFYWYHLIHFFPCKYAFMKRIRHDRNTEGPALPHWLDYATDKYGAKLVADMKIVFSILYLYLPVPIFWSLFDQQVYFEHY